jgi:hypothetical protein
LLKKKLAKNYQINEDEKGLVFTIRIKPNGRVVFLTGLWLLGYSILLVTVLIGLINDPDKLDADLLVFMFFFSLMGLFFLKILLWQLKGKERISLDGNEIKIEKLGTLFTYPRTFEIEQVEGIANTIAATTPNWIKFWGLGGGQIQMTYGGQVKYFGQTLSTSEATEIIEKIKVRLNL